MNKETIKQINKRWSKGCVLLQSYIILKINQKASKDCVEAN